MKFKELNKIEPIVRFEVGSIATIGMVTAPSEGIKLVAVGLFLGATAGPEVVGGIVYHGRQTALAVRNIIQRLNC